MAHASTWLRSEKGVSVASCCYITQSYQEQRHQLVSPRVLLPCIIRRIGQKRMYTPYMYREFGGFPAKNTVCTPYI